jgi:hypothetical protein
MQKRLRDNNMRFFGTQIASNHGEHGKGPILIAEVRMLRIANILAITALTTGLASVVGPSAWATPLEAPGSCPTGCGTILGATTLDPMILHFDENGNATIAVNGGAAVPLMGMQERDPSAPAGGGRLPVLAYALPQPVVSGDACFDDPPSYGGGLSDCLRFTDNTGVFNGAITGAGSQMIFYSIAEAPFALADTGFPANIGTGNLVTFLETVNPDGSSGFDYQPGGVPYPANDEYVGISDGPGGEVRIPEPVPLALLGSALAATGLAIRRRHQYRQFRSNPRGALRHD